jgi:hypothetical protein
MEGVGFEPTKARAGRFTVCSLWPLGYPSARSPSLSSVWLAKVLFHSSRGRRRDSNPRPTDYKSVALPTELHRQTPYLQQVGLDDDAGTGSTTSTQLTAKHPSYSHPRRGWFSGGRAYYRAVAPAVNSWAERTTATPFCPASAKGRLAVEDTGEDAPAVELRERSCAGSAALHAADTPHRAARPPPPRH